MTSEAMTAALNRWCDEYCVADNARAELHQLLASPPSEQDGRSRTMSNDDCDDAEVMRIWRECGLPEYFLGNGGTNHKLLAFWERAYDAGYRKRCSEQHIARAEAAAIECCAKVLQRGIAHANQRGRTCCAQSISNEIDNIRALAPANTGDEALTQDELALAATGAQLAIAWWKKAEGNKTKYAKDEIAKYTRLIEKIDGPLLRASERD